MLKELNQLLQRCTSEEGVSYTHPNVSFNVLFSELLTEITI